MTVKVNCCELPVQLLAIGVTVSKAVDGTLEIYVAVKEEMLPLPLDANPMASLLLIQLKIVPSTTTLPLLVVPVNEIGATICVAHNTWLGIAATEGIGFTLMVNCIGCPLHPLEKGVTDIIPLIGILEGLPALNPLISPCPEETTPMSVFELVQL